MSSKEMFLGKAKMPQNTSDSSGGGYDDLSDASDIDPLGLAKGFVMIHENYCQARYRPGRVSKDTLLYVCLNKPDWRSLAQATSGRSRSISRHIRSQW